MVHHDLPVFPLRDAASRDAFFFGHHGARCLAARRKDRTARPHNGVYDGGIHGGYNRVNMVGKWLVWLTWGL